MKTLSVFLICVAICQIVDKTKSQQCPAFGSEESILGWMLQGHIYQTMTANIGLHCLSVCLKDDRCQSFNFVMSVRMCEFSDRTKEARPEEFIPDADRYYFRKYINRVPLGSISELAAESCKEIQMSEGRSSSGKYWMSLIKPGVPVLAFCNMKTEDVDECTASSPVCHVNATCSNTLGSYRCTCKPGYAGDGKTCRDFDECTSSIAVCHVNALCSNTFGSYHCACKLGYAGDGKTCRDVNECAASSRVCHIKASCTNTPGSYRCTCKPGYSGNGKMCKDTNECNASPSPCHVKAKCKNNQGSYLCSCEAGYTGDGKACTDIDECTSGLHSCHSFGATCTNTVGSYSCSCGRNCIHSASECRNYNTLSSFDRKVTYYNSHHCDTGIGPAWFRFQGAAGTRMPTSCPPTHRCNTHAPGWLSGGHPSVADGQVNKKVCFHWTSDCCLWSTTVKVRNCGSFYVYYLNSTVGCYLRYCGTD
ncbi:uromodulin-like [Montipora capricornis]|uniref:uromodulin-like n=1 Tax=Montipora capricornis TaxID=246305 RepID=UPI0035F14865